MNSETLQIAMIIASTIIISLPIAEAMRRFFIAQLFKAQNLQDIAKIVNNAHDQIK
jgi:hypothetical protein